MQQKKEIELCKNDMTWQGHLLSQPDLAVC